MVSSRGLREIKRPCKIIKRLILEELSRLPFEFDLDNLMCMGKASVEERKWHSRRVVACDQTSVSLSTTLQME